MQGPGSHGPFLALPEGDELTHYWQDGSRQFYWEVCDPQSYEDTLGGGVIKQLRLLRGVVGIIQILLPVCVLGFVFGFFPTIRYVERQWLWSLVTFFAALLIYALLIIPSYWSSEYEAHATIWAAFPKKLDQIDLDPIELSKKMEQLMPCKKMLIKAQQHGSNENPHDENKPPPRTIPPKAGE